MAEAHAEQEQIDALKKWWKENGSSVILGIVLGVGGLFGWRGWQAYQQKMAGGASTEFSQLTQAAAQGNREIVASIGGDLKKNNAGTPYAGLAALYAAKLASGADDLEAAATELRWAAEHADQPVIRDLARLRLTRVLIAQNQAGEALKLLGEAWPVGFTSLVEEARGDALVALGKATEAAAAYDRALTDASGDVEFLRLKRADLGVAAPSTSTPSLPLPGGG